MDNRHWKFESKKFETENNLTGISGDYKFPGNVTAMEFVNGRAYEYAMQFEGGLDGLNKIWLYICLMNPKKGLDKVPVDKADQTSIACAIIGVSSLYHVDDIVNFVSIWNKAKNPEDFKNYIQAPEQQTILRQIGALFPKGEVNWLPAPETLLRIRDQIAKQRRDAEQKKNNAPKL